MYTLKKSEHFFNWQNKISNHSAIYTTMSSRPTFDRLNINELFVFKSYQIKKLYFKVINLFATI